MTTSKSAASAANPSYLPCRFEIRRLSIAEKDFILAILVHSNTFCSPVWPLLYPEDKVARVHAAMGRFEYLVVHQIESGMSFGVFDTEYKYKRPESGATGGKVYWDPKNLDASAEDLLEQMDFPLVSIAMSYDGINPLDMGKLAPAIELFPQFGTVYHGLGVRDQRDPVSWQATAPKQVLMRNATSTRADYEGHGLMKKLAHFLMREAALRGYRGIQIEAAHDRVASTWLNPPEPFKAELISQLDSVTYEEKDERTGQMIKPFAPSKQVFSKIFVTL